MIYLNLSENMQDVIPEDFQRFPRFLKKFIYKFRKKSGALYIKEIEDKVIINIAEINNKSLKRIGKYFRVKCIKTVCLSKDLENNQEFLEFLNGQDIFVLNGKWLENYLIIKLVNYVVQNKKENLLGQEISILINKVNEVWVENIKELARNVKILNIITFYGDRFKKIEKELYEQEGILLNTSNNFKKSLIKSDIIINVDFFEEELNQYNFPRRSCIINMQKKEKIDTKSFDGIYVLDYEISMPRKYLKYIVNLKNFENTILYESFIYKRTTFKNIKNEIESDEIKIMGLNGKNGKIRKSEFSALSKNKNGFTNY